jgi:hypothetical protein
MPFGICYEQISHLPAAIRHRPVWARHPRSAIRYSPFFRFILNHSFSREKIFFIGRCSMPEKTTLERARRDKRQGKAPTTQAGEFVREEIEHVRRGKHGARSTKQAIAIGLSKARRAGVKLPPPKNGRTSARTRKQAARDYSTGQTGRKKAPSRKRSRAVSRALKREGRRAASKKALSRQAKQSRRRRAS